MYSVEKITKGLEQEYKMQARVIALSEAVTFLGSELECYKMAYRFKNKENRVSYSENLESWFVDFPFWFTIEFAQRIK